MSYPQCETRLGANHTLCTYVLSSFLSRLGGSVPSHKHFVEQNNFFPAKHFVLYESEMLKNICGNITSVRGKEMN